MTDFLTFFKNGIIATRAWEWAAIATALLYVILAAYENSWCWLFGIISSAIYTWFNLELNLKMDTALSAYYVAAGIYGWYYWLRGGRHKQEATVTEIPVRELLVCLPAGTAATFVLGYLLKNYLSASVPYTDAALSSFSLVATWMTARKYLSSWLFWIVIDAGYVGLYLYKSAPMTAMLYLIYVIIAAAAYFKWKKSRI